MFPATVLVIDSDLGIVNAFGKSLGRQGFEVYGATSPDEGWEFLRKKQPQALILDIQVPGQQELQFLRKSKALYASLPVIVITAYSTSFTEADARREGADGYFPKPFDLDALIEKLKAVAFNDSDAAAELSDAGQHAAAVSRRPKYESFNHHCLERSMAV
jgi:DNA-binding response OmpR family regulator